VPLRFLSPRRHRYPIRALSPIQGLPLLVWSSLVLILASRSVSAAVEPSFDRSKDLLSLHLFPPFSRRKRVQPPSCSNNYRCESQPVTLFLFSYIFTTLSLCRSVIRSFHTILHNYNLLLANLTSLPFVALRILYSSSRPPNHTRARRMNQEPC